MSKEYPRFFITLVGEPRDVTRLADRIEDSVRAIGDAAFPAKIVSNELLAGGTRLRAEAAVEALRDSVEDTGDALRASARKVHDWAKKINEYRKKFDADHAEQDYMYKQLKVAEPRLNFLRAKGDDLSPAQREEFGRLWGYVGELKRNIQTNHDAAQRNLREYEDEADRVGRSLVSESLTSPAATSRDRFVRDLLGVSNGLDKLLNITEFAGVFVGGIGALGTKLGGAAARRALKQITKTLNKTLIAGSGAKLGADTVAAAGGANVSPAGIFFDTVNLKGVGPLDNLKEGLLDKVDSPTREALDQGIRKVEERIRGELIPPPEPARPRPGRQENDDWQGDPPDRSNYA